MSAQAASKRNYHHGDLKQALLDETARILREEGEEALSLRTLAAKLGVSRTAPYNHFKNKQSLLCAVAEDGFTRFNQSMKNARDLSRDKGGEAITRAMVKAYLDFARSHREYYDLMFAGEFWRSEDLTPALKTKARSVLRQDIERLKRGQQRGLIAQDLDTVQFSQMYWGTLHGISRLSLDGVFTDNTSLKKLCDSTATMLWQQLDPKGN
ncbi:TetR/AcrR family transcriptional regulator [Halioglobus maricola]|uniref:TetR/AcrR family transcriptional regulator n=1 Tax=Halioglobus maricola TaxID=2601894 RepID=A0A5P9NHA1_9GAMM|nr:TetR/AcrR family transcriptional regulator [Halioglobus maricola]QFU75200.1 TetR/AcrR family transcriptional regulator [Halioglobus maricola]